MTEQEFYAAVVKTSYMFVTLWGERDNETNDLAQTASGRPATALKLKIRLLSDKEYLRVRNRRRF